MSIGSQEWQTACFHRIVDAVVWPPVPPSSKTNALISLDGDNIDA